MLYIKEVFNILKILSNCALIGIWQSCRKFDRYQLVSFLIDILLHTGCGHT